MAFLDPVSLLSIAIPSLAWIEQTEYFYMNVFLETFQMLVIIVSNVKNIYFQTAMTPFCLFT